MFSYKCYFLRLQRGDERLGAWLLTCTITIVMNQCCNCFPSLQRLKCRHKRAKKYSEKYTCNHCWYVQIWFKSVPCVAMFKFDLRTFLVYNFLEWPTANLCFVNTKVFIYYFNNLIKIKESHRFLKLNWISSKYKMQSCG